MPDTDSRPDGQCPDERDDAFAERIAAPLRAAERPDPLLGSRIVATLGAGGRDVQPVHAGDRGAPHLSQKPTRTRHRAWWERKLVIGVGPMAGLAAAACVAVVVFLSHGQSGPARPSVAMARGGAESANAPARVDTVRLVRFVFVASDARSVSLVGDFNGWDRSAARLTRVGDSVWTATVQLPAGRHEYAFLLDGRRWVVDPNAPSTSVDEFGVASSILTVDETGRAATRGT